MAIKFEETSQLEALNRAIKAAKHLRAADAAAVAEAKRLAMVLDDPDYPIIAGKFDNVSAARYMEALKALMLTPDARLKGEKPKESKPSTKNGPVSELDLQRAKYRRA
ncbi:terminase small subunit [Arcanobacterium haemolyticum]